MQDLRTAQRRCLHHSHYPSDTPRSAAVVRSILVVVHSPVLHSNPVGVAHNRGSGHTVAVVGSFGRRTSEVEVTENRIGYGRRREDIEEVGICRP